jgi:3-deoxy-D-manno-octulosonic-acid transferase
MFLASSTHPGEDEQMLEAALDLSRAYPDLLTIIVPRHPQRGAEIEALASARGFSPARRSTGGLPTATTQIYVADTLGELGLFYRAAPFAFLGKSLAAHGGQNPLEPARLGTAIITGPHTGNFDEIFHVLLEAQGEGRVNSASELASLANRWLGDPSLMANRGEAAKAAAEALGGALTATIDLAENLLIAHARA